jgi:hypothetical protein
MDRSEALKIAADQFKAMNRELFKTYTLPRDAMNRRIAEIEARYSFRHGWMSVSGFSLSCDEFAPGDPGQGGWAWA